jgi:hypothetical protein
MATIAKRRAKKAVTVRRKSSNNGRIAKKDLSESYNRFKVHGGKQYSGMQIGRSHSWYYDKGEWKETKITPDLWEIRYAVTKRRKGKAPEGSGVPVGTGYHWFIFAHQDVHKLNANDYTTVMTGLKYKLGHKRADKEKWNASLKAQRKHLTEFLAQMIAQLQKDPVPIEFEYKETVYAGEAIPLPGSCHDGICDQHDITLNNDHFGILHCTPAGWRMKNVKDQKFVDTIGAEVMLWYE